jgi:hypothetical protein
MTCIEYLYKEGEKACEKEPLIVRVSGRISGEIRKVTGGFQYFPKGQKTGGEILDTVTKVKRTLRDDYVESIAI